MTDLLLDAGFDLAIKDGDLVVGESTEQHQQLLILLDAGELRQFPTRGVGARQFLLEENSIGALNGKIKREFERDGMMVNRISTSANGALQIDATYE